MGAMPATQHMTAEEFLRLPDTDDLRNAELVEGELIVDPPRARHQLVAGELIYALMTWSRSGEARGSVWHNLGVQLDERNVYQPDVLWYQAEVQVDLDARPPSPLPQIAVEVRSPSTWRYDIGAKKAAYERAGLRELWLVDTAASEVLVFRRSEAGAPGFDISLELERDATLTSPQLDGFELPLAELFPE
jgi:Uma2 family endonuclease